MIDMLRTLVLLTTVAGALIGALSAAYSARIVSTLGTILVTGVGIFAVSDSAVTIHALFFATVGILAAAWVGQKIGNCFDSLQSPPA